MRRAARHSAGSAASASASTVSAAGHSAAAAAEQDQEEIARSSKTGATFAAWYDAYWTGRGIWKWNNALEAYQQHFAGLSGQRLKLVEVGVEAGGAISMWRSVLGARCHVYGFGTDASVMEFTDPMATMTYGDQMNAQSWISFFNLTTRGSVDLVVTSGGRPPEEMVLGMMQAFNHLAPGGMVSFEDLHGRPERLEPFFSATVHFMARESELNQVASVHIYPFMMLLQKAGNEQRGALAFGGNTTVVFSFDDLWAAVPWHAGGHIMLQNARWGSFFHERVLRPVVKMFGELHQSESWNATPKGCTRTVDEVCSMTARLSPMQAAIRGVHIYKDRLIVEVAASHVLLQAVRRGTYWPHALEKFPDG